MKALPFVLVAIGAFTLTQLAHSQAPAAAQTAAQRLQTIRAKNKEILDRQTETLKKLEELQLEAQQVKFLGKRS